MPNCEFYAVPIISNAPPYSKYRITTSWDNIGVVVLNKETGKNCFILRLGVLEKHIIEEMAQADILLVDGTVWTNDEMIKLGFSSKLGTDMGHLPLSGKGGLIEILDTLENQENINAHK